MVVMAKLMTITPTTAREKSKGIPQAAMNPDPPLTKAAIF
jgi:hypothetical protein